MTGVQVCPRQRMLHHPDDTDLRALVGCCRVAGHDGPCKFPPSFPGADPPKPALTTICSPLSGRHREPVDAAGFCSCGTTVCQSCGEFHFKTYGHTWTPHHIQVARDEARRRRDDPRRTR